MCEVSWAPGAGVPCYSFGREDMKQRNEFLLHTSLLYSELEVALEAFLMQASAFTVICCFAGFAGLTLCFMSASKLELPTAWL